MKLSSVLVNLILATGALASPVKFAKRGVSSASGSHSSASASVAHSSASISSVAHSSSAPASSSSSYVYSPTMSLDEATETEGSVTVQNGKFFSIYKPKFFYINMFELEQAPIIEGYNLIYNVSIPGLSPVYPYIHCNSNYSICQVTTGEAEINAASTITALTLSPLFDLTETYFMIAGIAGVNPYQGTLGSVTFAKFAIQVGLAYQVDSRQMPSNWTTGYYPFGTTYSDQYPETIYGSEIFELNEKLRDRAVELAETVELNNGTEGNAEFRALYDYSPANELPSVVKCDTATSDVYWFGSDLGEAFGNFTELISNGTATYCSTQQEDNATLESMLRAAKHGLVDFERIVVMRTCSDFDRPPPKYQNDTTYFFNEVSQGGISASIKNLLIASKPFVEDVINNWDDIYAKNTKYSAENYIGDYFGTLGGTPDFGIEDLTVA